MDETTKEAGVLPTPRSTPWAEASLVQGSGMSALDVHLKLHEEETQDENDELALEERTYVQFSKFLGETVTKADDARKDLLASAKEKYSNRKARRAEARKLLAEQGEAMGNPVHTPASWNSQTPTSVSSKSSATSSAGIGITPKKMDFSPATTPAAAKAPVVVDKLPTVHEDSVHAGAKRDAPTTKTTGKVLIGRVQDGEILLMEVADDLPKVLGFTEASGACISDVTMVGDCAVFLVEGQVYPAIYHKPDGYYFDSVTRQSHPINFVSQDGYPLCIKSIASLEHTLVVLSVEGFVYKAEYKKGTGSFTDIRMVDFTTECEGSEYQRIKAMAIGLGSFAYGFPTNDMEDPSTRSRALKASLGSAASPAELTNMILPASRTSAKVTSGNKCMFTLAFDVKQRGLGYYIKDGNDNLVVLKKFKNGVLLDVAANCSYIFGCKTNGGVSYTGDLKNWSDFLLGNGICIRKIAAGATFVLGASDCGRLVVMKPKDGASNVLAWNGINLANPLDAEVVEISHIAAFKDEYIVAVVEVDCGEDNGEDKGHENKKQRAAGN